MKREVALDILELSKRSYDAMAGEFSATRAKFWEELAFLAEHATPGMNVLDIGCGNGRFYPLLKERNIEYTGLDSSRGLLEKAKSFYPGVRFVEGDATELPFPDRSFDIAFSFATLHHIPSKKLRAASIKEAGRVLRPGSTLILTVWDLWQMKYFGRVLYSSLKSALGISTLDPGDTMLTFGKKKDPRFLHAFTLRGLKKLLEKNGFNVVGSEIIERKSGSGQRNILIVAKRR